MCNREVKLWLCLPLFANFIFVNYAKSSQFNRNVIGNVTLEQKISPHRFCIELKLVKRIP